MSQKEDVLGICPRCGGECYSLICDEEEKHPMCVYCLERICLRNLANYPKSTNSGSRERAEGKERTMEQHFVTFLSPGMFVAEVTEKPIDSWDVEAAQKMAVNITERYNAKPYGFYFTTRGRTETELDSREIKRSGTYYLPHCKVETLAEIKRRADPKDSILVSNMECNHWDKVVTTTEGWKCTQPLNKGDVVLERSQ